MHFLKDSQRMHNYFIYQRKLPVNLPVANTRALVNERRSKQNFRKCPSESQPDERVKTQALRHTVFH